MIVHLDRVTDAVFTELEQLVPAGMTLRRASALDEATLVREVAGARYLLLGRAALSETVIRAALPDLRLVQKLGRGVDNVDVEALRRLGVGLAVTAGGNAEQVAEHALLLMLAAVRRLDESFRQMAAGGWPRDQLRHSVGTLRGRRVGIIGFGHSGRALARLLEPFGAEVVYHAPRPVSQAELGGTPGRAVTLDELLLTSDVISPHVPLTHETRGLLDAATLARTKRGVVLVNISRGPVVDQEALVALLRDGHVAAAGLDVFDGEPLDPASPLRTLPGVILTPHIAGASRETVLRVARHGLANIDSCERGIPLPESDVLLPVGDGTPP